MTYQPLTQHNIMELWLFDTCNFHCGYCSLTTDGSVKRADQLEPFRNQEYISSLLRFFKENRPSGRPWAVILTGGEPLLMPHLSEFVSELGKGGDTVAIYSNLSQPLSRVLSQEAMTYVSYIEASFHPDWYLGHHKADDFFENVAQVKAAGISVLVRFVGTPHMLDMLPELEERCKRQGVTFFPTTLFDPDYPRAYTEAERTRLNSYMVGYSSLVQLEGGLLMQGRRCFAADRLFAARLHKGGDITPCISAGSPVLGNIFSNTLRPLPGLKPCFKADGLCSCDIHFQQGIVEGVDDTLEFAQILSGRGERSAPGYVQWKRKNRVETSNDIWVGQGVSTGSKKELLRFKADKETTT